MISLRDAGRKQKTYPDGDVVDSHIQLFCCIFFDITKTAAQYWITISDTQARNYGIEYKGDVQVPVMLRMFQQGETG